MATPAGADPALHRAILAGDSAEVARLASLAASPQDLNLRDSDGMTPWHLATCAVRYSCLAPIVARVAALELASPRCAHLQPEATLRWARSSFSSMPAHGGTSAAPWDEDANEFQAAFLRQLSHAGPLVSLYVVFGGERGVEGRGVVGVQRPGKQVVVVAYTARCLLITPLPQVSAVAPPWQRGLR